MYSGLCSCPTYEAPLHHCHQTAVLILLDAPGQVNARVPGVDARVDEPEPTPTGGQMGDERQGVHGV
ncbi:hypothetical protein K503DRAFT_775445 [Rhizopogon vinicolor AM-OR11-026]|uniref:Uncharacterized protein n=1 Tax=Rhizopogon vinicolor AM-OR11-026 TaxID=1314800 RepID=A0A1B7MLZ6_9AGAM|nr:hypothetical protein K503DRAFT_775445 [Rhizopogon vinicolor AM-OR11-026]